MYLVCLQARYNSYFLVNCYTDVLGLTQQNTCICVQQLLAAEDQFIVSYVTSDLVSLSLVAALSVFLILVVALVIAVCILCKRKGSGTLIRFLIFYL